MSSVAAGMKENTNVRGKGREGGFFEQELESTDTETAHEIKQEILPSPSVSDMDCNSDGAPDQEGQYGLLSGDPSISHPVCPQGEITGKTVTLSAKPGDDCVRVEKTQNLDNHKTVTCKLENVEDTAVAVSSSKGSSKSPTNESRLKGSLNSTKSEITVQSSSVGQESGLFPLTWTSDVTESSPSSSGDFDFKPRRRQNDRSRNKLSLKRTEGKMGGVSKLGLFKEKVNLRNESVEEAVNGQDIHNVIPEESKKQKLHSDTVQEKDESLNTKNNVSESVRHSTIDCSVLLKDIRLKHLETFNEPLKLKTSSMERPIKNQREILPAPEKETTPKSSSDDELMSASFLHVGNCVQSPSTKEVKESTHQSPSHTTKYGDLFVNGLEEVGTASRGFEQRDESENQRNKRPKQSRLALSSRQSNKDKDSILNTTKYFSHNEKKRQRAEYQKLTTDLESDNVSDRKNQNSTHQTEENQRFSGAEEPMDVEVALPKTTPVDIGSSPEEVDGLSSDNYHSGENQGTSSPKQMQDHLVHISDDSCSGEVSLVEDVENGPLGEYEDGIIDLSQEVDDGDESDSWFDSIFGNVRLVMDLKTADIVYLTQRNKRYLHNIFQGKRACERHQCYKKKGPQRIGMASNVRLGPFKEEQMDAVMGELVNIYCTKHFKYMDYLSKVLLPEAMTKIYMDVHKVNHSHAEEVMKGLQKEEPRVI